MTISKMIWLAPKKNSDFLKKTWMKSNIDTNSYLVFSVWKVDGTPLEETQHRLAKKGLKDPWIRNEVWQYRISDRFSNPIKVRFS